MLDSQSTPRYEESRFRFQRAAKKIKTIRMMTPDGIAIPGDDEVFMPQDSASRPSFDAHRSKFARPSNSSAGSISIVRRTSTKTVDTVKSVAHALSAKSMRELLTTESFHEDNAALGSMSETKTALDYHSWKHFVRYPALRWSLYLNVLALFLHFSASSLDATWYKIKPLEREKKQRDRNATSKDDRQKRLGFPYFVVAFGPYSVLGDSALSVSSTAGAVNMTDWVEETCSDVFFFKLKFHHWIRTITELGAVGDHRKKTAAGSNKCEDVNELFCHHLRRQNPTNFLQLCGTLDGDVEHQNQSGSELLRARCRLTCGLCKFKDFHSTIEHRWEKVASHTSCNLNILQPLGDEFDEHACQAAATGSRNCDNEVVTKNGLCFCVRIGKRCDHLPDKTASLWEYNAFATSPDITKQAKAFCFFFAVTFWYIQKLYFEPHSVSVYVRETLAEDLSGSEEFKEINDLFIKYYRTDRKEITPELRLILFGWGAQGVASICTWFWSLRLFDPKARARRVLVHVVTWCSSVIPGALLCVFFALTRAWDAFRYLIIRWNVKVTSSSSHPGSPYWKLQWHREQTSSKSSTWIIYSCCCKLPRWFFGHFLRLNEWHGFVEQESLCSENEATILDKLDIKDRPLQNILVWRKSALIMALAAGVVMLPLSLSEVLFSMQGALDETRLAIPDRWDKFKSLQRNGHAQEDDLSDLYQLYMVFKEGAHAGDRTGKPMFSEYLMYMVYKFIRLVYDVDATGMMWKKIFLLISELAAVGFVSLALVSHFWGCTSRAYSVAAGAMIAFSPTVVAFLPVWLFMDERILTQIDEHLVAVTGEIAHRMHLDEESYNCWSHINEAMEDVYDFGNTTDMVCRNLLRLDWWAIRGSRFTQAKEMCQNMLTTIWPSLREQAAKYETLAREGCAGVQQILFGDTDPRAQLALYNDSIDTFLSKIKYIAPCEKSKGTQLTIFEIYKYLIGAFAGLKHAVIAQENLLPFSFTLLPACIFVAERVRLLLPLVRIPVLAMTLIPLIMAPLSFIMFLPFWQFLANFYVFTAVLLRVAGLILYIFGTEALTTAPMPRTDLKLNIAKMKHLCHFLNYLSIAFIIFWFFCGSSISFDQRAAVVTFAQRSLGFMISKFSKVIFNYTISIVLSIDFLLYLICQHHMFELGIMAMKSSATLWHPVDIDLASQSQKILHLAETGTFEEMQSGVYGESVADKVFWERVAIDDVLQSSGAQRRTLDTMLSIRTGLDTVVCPKSPFAEVELRAMPNPEESKALNFLGDEYDPSSSSFLGSSQSSTSFRKC